MNFLYAFLIGGTICMIAQIVQDIFNLTPGHITAIFVMLGASLELFDIYDLILKIGGAGALLPITSFGHSLAHAAFQGAINSNYLGIFTAMFEKVSAGIAVAIVLSVLVALVFRPKE